MSGRQSFLSILSLTLKQKIHIYRHAQPDTPTILEAVSFRPESAYFPTVWVLIWSPDVSGINPETRLPTRPTARRVHLSPPRWLVQREMRHQRQMRNAPMPQVSEALHNFLQARKTPTNADLVDRWSIDMETQVNAIVGDGEPVAGKKSTWSNGSDTWHSIRIPRNAAIEPTWEDYKIGYPFDLYAEGIGMTGFDWKARRSRHFGYDFDALTGHAQGIGIDDKDLEKVKQAACACPTSKSAAVRVAAASTSMSTWTRPAFPRRIIPSTPPWPVASWG